MQFKSIILIVLMPNRMISHSVALTAQSFMFISLFDFQNNLVRYVVYMILFPIYRLRKQFNERVSDLPKIALPLSCRTACRT